MLSSRMAARKQLANDRMGVHGNDLRDSSRAPPFQLLRLMAPFNNMLSNSAPLDRWKALFKLLFVGQTIGVSPARDSLALEQLCGAQSGCRSAQRLRTKPRTISPAHTELVIDVDQRQVTALYTTPRHPVCPVLRFSEATDPISKR